MPANRFLRGFEGARNDEVAQRAPADVRRVLDNGLRLRWKPGLKTFWLRLRTGRCLRHCHGELHKHEYQRAFLCRLYGKLPEHRHNPANFGLEDGRFPPGLPHEVALTESSRCSPVTLHTLA